MIVRGVASSALFIARSSLAFECRRGIGTSGMHESANVRVTPGGKTAATIAAGFSSPLGTQVEGNAPKGSARGLLGLTPELGAVFPSGPLATWSVEDVAARVCALGRELAHDVGTRENDIAADFDAHADKFRESGVDGETLSRVTVAMLQNDLGVSVYEHRAKIVGWVKDHLEVRAQPAPASIVRFSVEMYLRKSLPRTVAPKRLCEPAGKRPRQWTHARIGVDASMPAPTRRYVVTAPDVAAHPKARGRGLPRLRARHPRRDLGLRR